MSTATTRFGAATAALVLIAAATSEASGVWNDRLVSTMPIPRTQFGVATMQNGDVIVSGNNALDNTTSIWTPATNTWRMGSSGMHFKRGSHAMTTLADGRIMAAGGDVASPVNPYLVPALSRTVEILDPATMLWTVVANMTAERRGFGLATLQNGSVLAVGGMSNENHLPYMTSAELYDPATNTWARVASPKRDRYGANAVTLANGSVLLAGGTANTPSNNGHATEVFDPESNSWADGAFLTTRRNGFGMVALHNGSVLAAGGYSGTVDLNSAEIYMPGANTWVIIESMFAKRPGCRAALLANGSVVVMGGYVSKASGNRSEIYGGGSKFRCVDANVTAGGARGGYMCVPATSGVDQGSCESSCGPDATPHFRCVKDQCVEIPGMSGTTKDACGEICGRDDVPPCTGDRALSCSSDPGSWCCAIDVHDCACTKYAPAAKIEQQCTASPNNGIDCQTCKGSTHCPV